MKYSYSEFSLVMQVFCRLFDCSETSGIRTEKRSNLPRIKGAKRSRHKIKYGGCADDLVPDKNTKANRQALVTAARKLGFYAKDEGDHVHIHQNP